MTKIGIYYKDLYVTMWKLHMKQWLFFFFSLVIVPLTVSNSIVHAPSLQCGDGEFY